LLNLVKDDWWAKMTESSQDDCCKSHDD
jgi:hypothetical protein